MCAKSLYSCPTLGNSVDYSLPGSSVLCPSILAWSGLLCPPPPDLLDAGIEPVSLMSPELAGVLYN